MLLSDAYDLVEMAAMGAKSVFQALFDAIPGFAGALAVIFLVSLVISLLIMPLRGSVFLLAAGSDGVKKPERSSTQRTLDDMHKRMRANAAFTASQKKSWGSGYRRNR